MPGEEAILVAVRSRPLLDSDACPYNSSLKFFKESREVECQERSFNFNFVFPPDATNLDVYTTAVSSRLEYIFNGKSLHTFLMPVSVMKFNYFALNIFLMIN